MSLDAFLEFICDKRINSETHEGWDDCCKCTEESCEWEGKDQAKYVRDNWQPRESTQDWLGEMIIWGLPFIYCFFSWLFLSFIVNCGGSSIFSSLNCCIINFISWGSIVINWSFRFIICSSRCWWCLGGSNVISSVYWWWIISWNNSDKCN